MADFGGGGYGRNPAGCTDNAPPPYESGAYAGSTYDDPRRGDHGHYPQQPQHHQQQNTGYGSEHQQGQYAAEAVRKPGSHAGAPEIFKIVCEANPSFYLTDRGGELVLASGDEANPRQQWIKDASHGDKKDKEGFPAFALINKGSGLALYHEDKKDKVYLRPYDPNSATESFLWSRSTDVGHGYQCIRPFTDIHLNLDADHGDKDHGGVKDGTSVILHKWNKQQNQKWKILPITTVGAFAAGSQAQKQFGGAEVVKLACEAKTDYYITARGDSVVLAAAEQSDPRQEWFKDVKLAANMKDESGSPAFVLINKATHKALQHGDKEFDKVVLAPLHDRVDESLLWTLSADVGKGYRCLRPVRNIHLNLDASHADKKHGGVQDGTELILYKWLDRENQKWKLTFL